MHGRTPFTPRFRSEYRGIRRKQISKYYKERVDLRQCGLDGILHRSCRYNGSHKLQLVGVGGKSWEQMLWPIEQVFDCDALSVRVARVDFAADVPEIPLEWFWTHVYSPRKRQVRVVGRTSEKCRDLRGCTIYLGSRLDCFRLYDKEAELKNRAKGALDEGKTGQPLTRVERQLRTRDPLNKQVSNP